MKRRSKVKPEVKPRPSASDDETGQYIRNIWLSKIGSERVDRAARYVQRGRRYHELSDADLMARWQTAFRAFAQKLNDQARQDYQDMESEIELRGLEVPVELVKDAIDELEARFQRAWKQVQLDPEKLKQAKEAIAGNFWAFIAKRDRSKN